MVIINQNIKKMIDTIRKKKTMQLNFEPYHKVILKINTPQIEFEFIDDLKNVGCVLTYELTKCDNTLLLTDLLRNEVKICRTDINSILKNINRIVNLDLSK